MISANRGQEAVIAKKHAGLLVGGKFLPESLGAGAAYRLAADAGDGP